MYYVTTGKIVKPSQVPNVKQLYSHTCWVASTQCLGCYYGMCIEANHLYELANNLPHGLCSCQICNKENTGSAIVNLLNTITPYNWEMLDCRSNPNVIRNFAQAAFQKNQPYILNYHIPYQSVGHSVVVSGGEAFSDIGYYANPPLRKFYVMDPAYGYVIQRSAEFIFNYASEVIYPI